MMRSRAALILAVLSLQAAGAAELPVGVAAPGVLAVSGSVGQAAQSVGYAGDWSADSRQTWRGDDGEPRVQFNLRGRAGDSRWGFGVRLRDLAGLPPSALASAADNIQFAWTREAGTFRFSGSFDDGRGSGTYTFTANPAFVAGMGTAGYRELTGENLVRLAVVDVTLGHVRGLAQAGYANLPLNDLVRTRIHKVTPEVVRDLAGVGYRNVAVEDLIKMSIHKATPEFIAALNARGFQNVATDDLVKMRIHKVTPEEVDQLKTLGYGAMGVDQLIKFRIHKVTPDYIRGMREVGFVTVSEDQLVKMRIHKVDAQFIRDARADGLTVQTPGDAVDLAIHGRRRPSARLRADAGDGPAARRSAPIALVRRLGGVPIRWRTRRGKIHACATDYLLH